MTKQEFESLYGNNVAIHCDTEEKANEFLALADSVGYKWFTEHSLKDMNFWKAYEEKTCYELTKKGFVYANVEFFNYEFIKYKLEKVEEQTYEEETIDDIIEEIKDYQKSINVLLNRLERKAKVGK